MSPGGLFEQVSGGYAPLAGGIEPRRMYPLAGLPLVGGQGGMMGSLLGMAATPGVTRMMGQVGMVPMGVGHDQNVYDLIMAQRFTQMQQEAMRQAAESDRRAYMQTFRGLAAMTGTPFGAQQRMAANALSSAAVMASPVLAEMMPDFLDQMAGARGSATVFANRVINAGRYRLDPVTGRMGMSADTVGALSGRLMQQMYSDEALPRAMGISAGQMGGLFQELQSRGLVSGYAAEGVGGGRAPMYGPGDVRGQVFSALRDLARDRPREFQRVAGGHGIDVAAGPQALTGGDLDRLMADPGIADRLRTFDAERIRRSLRSYTSAVAAMRDIFGDMGRPNAPMQELVRGLEALTGGSMAQIDPNRLGMMARQTYNLAKQTGVTLDNALMMQQHAAARGQQLGLEPVFAVAAAQGGLAFGGAYRAQGHAAHTAWGAMTADQLTQLDVNLRQQAAASPMANRMAAASRLANMVGGFDPNSAAARYVQAARTGQDVFEFAPGQNRALNVGDDEFIQMLTSAQAGRPGALRASGLTAADVRAALGQREINREQVQLYGMEGPVRRAQGREVGAFVAGRLQDVTAGRLQELLISRGVDRNEAARQAAAAAQRMAGGAVERMRNLTAEQIANTTTRTRAFGDIIREGLGPTGVLQGMGRADQEAFAATTGGLFYGDVERSLPGSQFAGVGSFQNYLRAFNPVVLDEADRQRMQTRMQSETEEAMAPLGRGSILRRAVDALQRAGARPNDPKAMMRVLAQTLGGVRTEDINQALLPQFQRVMDRLRSVRDLENRALRERDPVLRSRLMAQATGLRGELRGEGEGLVQAGEPFGMFTAGGLGADDIEQARLSSRRAATVLNDLAGLSGGIGGEVSAKAIEGVKAGKLTDPQMRQALIAGRAEDVDKVQAYVAAADEVRQLEALGDTSDAGKGVLAQTKADATALWGKLGEPLQKRYGAYMDRARAAVSTGGTAKTTTLDENAARRGGLKLMAQDVPEVSDVLVRAAQANPPVLTDYMARAVERLRRRSVPMRYTEKELDAFMARHPGMTREDAIEYSNAELQVKRLGIDEALIKKYQGGDTGPQARYRAIGMAMGDMSVRRWVVGKDDRADWRREHPGVTEKFTDEQRKAFLARRRDLEGAPAATVQQAMIDDRILHERQQEQQAAFATFWSSNQGGAAREALDQRVQDVGNLATRLLAAPESVQRLGTRAIELAQQLRGGQTRLRELASQYSSGDVARLLAQDYNPDQVDRRSPEGVALAAEIAKEVRGIDEQALAAGAELRDQEGLPGRQIQLGDPTEARRRVVERLRQSGAIDQATADRYMKYDLSPDRRRELREAARAQGTEANLRRELNIPAEATLTDWNRYQITALRLGAGSAAAARALLNRGRDVTGEELVQLRQGVKDRGQAMALLGIGETDLNKDNNQQRLRVVMTGLASQQTLMDLTGVLRAPKAGSADYERLRMAEFGYGTEAGQRVRLKIAPDETPKDIVNAQLREQEEMGNMAEAMRLLNIRVPAGGRLSDADYRRAAAMARRVGAARTMTTADAAEVAGLREAGRRLGTAVQARGLGAAGEVLQNWLAGGGLDVPAALRPQFDQLSERYRTVAGIAGGRGMAVGDLLGGESVIRTWGERQAAALREENRPTMDLIRDVLGAYGLDDKGPPSAAVLQALPYADTAAGKDMLRSIASSQRGLQTFARSRQGGPEGLRGIDLMMREYHEATDAGVKADDRKRKLAEFRARYKDLGGETQWQEFQRDVKIQELVGGFQVGPDRVGGRGDEAILQMVRRGIGGGAAVRPPGGQPGLPGQMTIHGELHIRGQTGYLANTYGSGDPGDRVPMP